MDDMLVGAALIALGFVLVYLGLNILFKRRKR